VMHYVTHLSEPNRVFHKYGTNLFLNIYELSYDEIPKMPNACHNGLGEMAAFLSVFQKR
jgi:hypothetical protein